MNKYFFIFDLDGTLTKKETLLEIAKNFNLSNLINLTSKSIEGEIPYEENFIKRVEILKNIELEKINKITSKIPLFEKIANFINENKQNCAIATTNIDFWIKDLVKNFNIPIYTSQVNITNNKIVSIKNILKKEEIVKKYQEQGYKVIFIGEGINDLEAMKIADISIGLGLVHMPASYLFDVMDYAIFDEDRLIYFLKQILGRKDKLSISIPAAGIGSRLKIKENKILLKFKDKTLLEKHIENFKNLQDVRIVIGYNSINIIKETLKYRKDILFVFNHQYLNTQTGYSFYLSSKFANAYIIEWDADLIMKNVKSLIAPKEYIGGSQILSQNPIYLKMNNNKVTKFSKESGNFEWSGPCCIKTNKLNKKENFYKNKYIFEILEECLPMPFEFVDGMDIDTYEDYLKAKELFNE